MNKWKSDELRAAALIVAGVAKSLNDKVNPCKCCGLNVAEDIEQTRANRELHGIVAKLRRLADGFDASAPVATNDDNNDDNDANITH